MSIKVAGSEILLSSVSYIQPKADASFIEAEAVTTYIEPEVALSYMDIQVTAQVTMPDVLTVEVITPTDDKTIAFSKGLSDSTDGFTDSITSVSFTKALSDTFTVPDNLFIGDIQPHTDNTDSIAPFTEDIRNVFTKSLADSISFTDAIDAVRLFERAFSDLSSLADIPYLSVIPDTTVDSTGATDSSTLATSKGLADDILMIDNMDGDIEFTAIKSVSEVLSNSDASIVAFSGAQTDNITTSSSGLIMMQDYSDITYFLEDYVGTSRTFT